MEVRRRWGWLLCAWALAGCGASAVEQHPGLLPPGVVVAPEGASAAPTREVAPEEVQGKATWYGDRHHGRKTASGEAFDMGAFTAAHRTLPFNTVVRVVEVETRRSVVVRINDRGPFKEGLIIDLAKAAAAEIGLLKRGVTQVQLEILVWGDGARYKAP